ncbi:MAG: hypothetical protein ABIT07_00070 [Ferruginibacter sp.]
MQRFLQYIILGFSVLVFLGCSNKNKLPDLHETFSYKDTRPFGAYIAYSLLANSFPDNWLALKNDPFATNSKWMSGDSTSLYLSLSNNFYVENEDADSLMNFVFKGNTVFIAAAEIDSVLLSKLYCKQENLNWINYMMPFGYTNTHLSLIKAVTTSPDTLHQYYYSPFANYFSQINSRYARIMGYNQNRQPNCIVFYWGRGRLFLHCDPRAFSNYFLLKGNNYQYFTQLLQVMPAKPEHVYWDDYYNKKNYKGQAGSFSTLNTIFKYPPLKWAFFISILLLSAYIFFNGKRRQRVVPIIAPLQNSSIAFAEAIAGLYLKKKNNKAVADKMVTYFNEYIRNHYFLNTNIINHDFLVALSRKSGAPLPKTETLYRTIKQVAENEVVDDFMLLNLNQQIQEFNKNKN